MSILHKSEVVWHSLEDKPKESGRYLCVTKIGRIGVATFSKYKDSSQWTARGNVMMWAEIPVPDFYNDEMLLLHAELDKLENRITSDKARISEIEEKLQKKLYEAMGDSSQ